MLQSLSSLLFTTNNRREKNSLIHSKKRHKSLTNIACSETKSPPENIKLRSLSYKHTLTTIRNSSASTETCIDGTEIVSDSHHQNGNTPRKTKGSFKWLKNRSLRNKQKLSGDKRRVLLPSTILLPKSNIVCFDTEPNFKSGSASNNRFSDLSQLLFHENKRISLNSQLSFESIDSGLSVFDESTRDDDYCRTSSGTTDRTSKAFPLSISSSFKKEEEEHCLKSKSDTHLFMVPNRERNNSSMNGAENSSIKSEQNDGLSESTKCDSNPVISRHASGRTSLCSKFASPRPMTSNSLLHRSFKGKFTPLNKLPQSSKIPKMVQQKSSRLQSDSSSTAMTVRSNHLPTSCKSLLMRHNFTSESDLRLRSSSHVQIEQILCGNKTKSDCCLNQCAHIFDCNLSVPSSDNYSG